MSPQPGIAGQSGRGASVVSFQEELYALNWMFFFLSLISVHYTIHNNGIMPSPPHTRAQAIVFGVWQILCNGHFIDTAINDNNKPGTNAVHTLHL